MRRTRANPSPGGFQALPMEAPKRIQKSRATKTRASQHQQPDRPQGRRQPLSGSSRGASPNSSHIDTTRTSPPRSSEEPPDEPFSREVSEEFHQAELEKQVDAETMKVLRSVESEMDANEPGTSDGPSGHAIHTIATYYHDNPQATIVPADKIISYLRGPNQSNQGDQVTNSTASGGDIARPSTPEQNSNNTFQPMTPVNGDIQKAEPETPPSTFSWKDALNPVRLIRTPLKFITRRTRKTPATDGQRARNVPATEAQQTRYATPADVNETPVRRGVLNGQAPATNPQPRTVAFTSTRREAQARRRALLYKPSNANPMPYITVLARGQSQSQIEAITGQSFGTNPKRGPNVDSHLPLYMRGTQYRDLPENWQAVSRHMLSPSPEETRPPSTPSVQTVVRKVPPASDSVNGNSRKSTTAEAEPVNAAYNDSLPNISALEPNERTSAKTFEDWKRSRDHARALEKRAREEAADREEYEEYSRSNNNNKRKRVVVKKPLYGKISDSTYGMPDNIWDTDSDEDMDEDITMSGGLAGNGDVIEQIFAGDLERVAVGDRVLLDSRSPSTSKVLQSCLKGARASGKSSTVIPSTTELSNHSSFRVPSGDDSDNDSEYADSASESSEEEEASISRTQRANEVEPGPSSQHSSNRNQLAREGPYPLYDVSDEEDWDISENDPRMKDLYPDKRSWCYTVRNIRSSGEEYGLSNEDIVTKVKEYALWYKAKMRYEKFYGKIAMSEIEKFNLTPWMRTARPYENAAFAFKEENPDKVEWPTPVAKPFEKLFPYQMYPPTLRRDPVETNSIVLEQSKRQLTPEEFGDPSKARPYTGNMFADRPITPAPKNDPKNVFVELEGQKVTKARTEALKYKPKLPSNLAHTSVMSPLQAVVAAPEVPGVAAPTESTSVVESAVVVEPVMEGQSSANIVIIAPEVRARFKGVTENDEVIAAIMAIPDEQHRGTFNFEDRRAEASNDPDICALLAGIPTGLFDGFFNFEPKLPTTLTPGWNGVAEDEAEWTAIRSRMDTGVGAL